MSGEEQAVNRRLDSWKAIADYLGRDVGTVRRWEKGLGLPVHRVPGGPGRSVFAFTADIDAWLRASSKPPAVPSLPDPVAAGAVPAPDLAPAIRRNHSKLLLGVAAAIIAVIAVGWLGMGRASARASRVEATMQGVIARDMDGAELWRHTFDAHYRTVLTEVARAAQIVPGRGPSIYVATSHRYRLPDDRAEGGSLLAFGDRGDLVKTFSFDDVVRFRGTAFGAPWVVTTFAVDGDGKGRRVAVAGHHYLWDPSIVTLLDSDWTRGGTFVHAGWIEALHWFAPDRLLIGGFSEARDGGMVGLLDPASLNGQGPEDRGTKYYCENCGSHQAIRMAVMPRTELNRVTGSRFNRAVIEVLPDRVVARTVEIPSLTGAEPAVDAIYEFTRSLEPISASFSAQYWDVHRKLEAEGKLHHTADACPDRQGPRQILMWEPQSGWRSRALVAAR